MIYDPWGQHYSQNGVSCSAGSVINQVTIDNEGWLYTLGMACYRP